MVSASYRVWSLLLVVTAAHGGGVVGFVLGGLFVALGVARIQLERKRGR